MKKYILRLIKSKKGKKYTHEYRDMRDNVLSKSYYEPLIKNLYIAPAYDKVKINFNKNDKVLAIGVDERGRKQYTYNPNYVQKANDNKYKKLIEFGNNYECIMKRINKDMISFEDSKKKQIAMILKMMDECNFRVGNEKYAKENKSFGVCTLENQHVKIGSSGITVDFIGKEGVRNTCRIKNKRLVKNLRTKKKTLGKQDRIFTYRSNNKYYNDKLGDKKDYCIYTDTDSVFYSALPLIKNKYPNADLSDDKFMTEKILNVAGEVQDFINKSYNLFASKMLNVQGRHRFDIKQECIAKSAFWVTKKRYGQWIINDGGLPCAKLDVKGLDIVRSNFPPAMRDIMTLTLKGILSNEDKDDIDERILNFKKSMKNESIENIALPTGVKGLGKYTSRHLGKSGIFTNVFKGTPAHVKASIKYNDLLKHFGLNNIEPIRNNSKIKWIYLKSNSFGIDAIAFKGYDDPKEIMDFISENVDYDKLYKGAMEKKIKMFYEALNWSLPVNKQNTLERFF